MKRRSGAGTSGNGSMSGFGGSDKIKDNRSVQVQKRNRKRPQVNKDDLWDVPDTDRNSFLEELKCGEPILHSTALDDDLDQPEDGGGEAPAAAVEEKRRRSRRGPSEELSVKLLVVEKKSSEPTATVSRRLVGKKPAKSRAEQAVKSTTNRRSMKDNQSSSSTRRPQSEERRSKRVSSDEEDDENDIEKPSSGRSSEEGGGADMMKRKKTKTSVSELDLVIDAFQQFCDNYRKDVESHDQKNILAMRENVTQLLTERVSACQSLKVLKRDNAKTASKIRSKTQRLLDGKHELMKAKCVQRQLLQQRSDLRQRLRDLRKGSSFIRDITTTHQDHGHTHTYGADSLAALLLEASFHKSHHGPQESVGPPPPGGTETPVKKRK